MTGRIGNYVGTKKRYYLLSIFLLQAILVLISAALLYTEAIQLESNSSLSIISIMAFAFGSQAAASRPFGVPPITTVVVTSAMVDLFADPQFFAKLSANKGRNQRASFILTFFVFGIIGGLCLKHVSGQFTLLIAGIIKLIGALIFLFAKGKKEEEKAGKEIEPQIAQAENRDHMTPEIIPLDTSNISQNV